MTKDDYLEDVYPRTKADLRLLFTNNVELKRQNEIYKIYSHIIKIAKDGSLNYMPNLKLAPWVGTNYDMTPQEVITRLKRYFPDCDYSLSGDHLIISWK